MEWRENSVCRHLPKERHSKVLKTGWQAECGGMESDDLLCSRNARPPKDGKGSLIVLLLAEHVRSECAPSMRAVKNNLAVSLSATWETRKALALAHGTFMGEKAILATRTGG
jgi:hypothetical protein